MTSPNPGTIYATGRRKTAIARVFMKPGHGVVTINRRAIEDYFPREILRQKLFQPLVAVDAMGNFDLGITVRGGGISGQAGAIRHGLARAHRKAQTGDQQCSQGLRCVELHLSSTFDLERRWELEVILQQTTLARLGSLPAV